MATKQVITNAASGYDYAVYVGCQTNGSGEAMKGTADTIHGGWAPDEHTAKQRADDAVAAALP